MEAELISHIFILLLVLFLHKTNSVHKINFIEDFIYTYSWLKKITLNF